MYPNLSARQCSSAPFAEHRSSSGAGAELESARTGLEERRAGKAGRGVGREREETWLKRRSEQDGTGEEENAAITGHKRDGERMHGEEEGEG